MNRYPEIYHAACNGLVQRPHKASTRQSVARCIRFYRRAADRAMVEHCLSHFAFIGWPLRIRPNGRYR